MCCVLLRKQQASILKKNLGPGFQWKKGTNQETKSQGPALVFQEIVEESMGPN